MKICFKKIKGFTLAEVMIVIAILGVAGALLIPTVMNTAPNTNKVMFRKAYSTLESAVSQLINNDTNYPVGMENKLWDSASGGYNGPTVSRGFNFEDGTLDGEKFCTLLADQLNTIAGTVSCDNPPNTGWGSFTTTDGIIWRTYEGLGSASAPGNDCFPLSTTTYAYTSRILIDVNGTKGPNCTFDSRGSNYNNNFNYQATCTNPDRFIVGVRFDGKLQVGCSTLPTCTTPTDQKAIDILMDPSKSN